MYDTWFETIKGILDGIVDFIKAFVDEMKGFIGGFKKEIEWPTSADNVDL